MKKVFLSLALTGLAGGHVMADCVRDTLVIEDVSKVKIETRDTVQRIVINGSKNDASFQYVQRIAIPDSSAVRRQMKSVRDFNKVSFQKKDGSRGSVGLSVHLGIGMNTMTGTPDGFKFRLWPSIEIAPSLLVDWNPFGPKNKWSIGFGVDWRYYRMDGATYWQKHVNDQLMLLPYAQGDSNTRTALRTFSLQVPLLYTHYFTSDRRGWGVKLGGILNINTGAHTEHGFNKDDYRTDVKIHDIGQRKLTVDAVAMVHVPSFVWLYFKYSPTTYFKDDDLKMNQLSFGLYW